MNRTFIKTPIWDMPGLLLENRLDVKAYLHLPLLASTELLELCDKKCRTQVLTEFGNSIQSVTASLPKREEITSKNN